MNLIDNVVDPILYENYLVKCVYSEKFHFLSGYLNNWIPVIGHYHQEGSNDREPNEEHRQKLKEGIYQDLFHYHIDWRFMPIESIFAIEKNYKDLKVHPESTKNTHLRYALFENYAPYEEKYFEMTYLRDFADFDTLAFWSSYVGIERWMKPKMKNFICPHKGTNLKSCKIKNNHVQCPAHGATFNVITGDLVKI